MGTRSLTFFYEDNKPLCCFYRQMDGYPQGHGVDLGEVLAPITLVNGYQFDMAAGTHANGPGCLAAQVIERLKDGQLGSIYMVDPDPESHTQGWQEYEYHIFINSNGEKTFDNKTPWTTRIDCRQCGRSPRVIFSGDFKNFLDWARTPKVDEDGNYIPVEILPNGGVDITKYAKPGLRDALKAGTVHVAFTKADGSRRTMNCTVNSDLIPDEKLSGGTSKRTYKDPDLFVVYDLDKKDWRSFRRERVLNYEVL